MQVTQELLDAVEGMPEGERVALPRDFKPGEYFLMWQRPGVLNATHPTQMGWQVCRVISVAQEACSYVVVNATNGGALWDTKFCRRITKERAIHILFES